MSENAKVLQYLESGGSLTCAGAIRLGITHNLRSRISNLIADGVSIAKSWKTVNKRNGDRATVRVYSL